MNSIIFGNKEYKLISEADYSNRVLTYQDFNSVEIGDNFDFEMVAKAIGEDGEEYNVFWIFTDTKGEEQELDCFDYSIINRVEIC
ncbi:MAG: hypothetical protein WC389_20110 [Lutibacter sp.]|jgi:hypothetical protein